MRIKRGQWFFIQSKTYVHAELSKYNNIFIITGKKHCYYNDIWHEKMWCTVYNR